MTLKQTALLLCCLLGWVVNRAAAAQDATLTLVAGEQEVSMKHNMDRTMLPPDATGSAAYLKGEMYLLRSGDKDPLIIAPIGFMTLTNVMGPHANVRTDCGAYFLTSLPTLKQTFVRITAADSTAECTTVDGVAAVPQEGPRPRLVFLFETHSRKVPDGMEVDVLRWDGAAGAYVADRALSIRLTQQFPDPKMSIVLSALARTR